MVRLLHVALRRALIAVSVAALCGAVPAELSAQTQDEFFDDTRLQEVQLSINAADWQSLKDRFEENTYYPADLRWRGLTVRNIGIRSRGSGTRNGVKPGLRVDINRYISNQEFVGLKAFVLDNAFSDPSLVRESVSMKLFNWFGIPTPREVHARLYVNGQFAGVYVIIESVDRTFVSRLFGAREGDVEAGGYLYEYEWAGPYGFEDLGSALEQYAIRFRPQTRDTDSMFALYQPIADMVRAISETPDDRFMSVVGSYLDLSRLIKSVAIENFLADDDGLVGEWGVNNFYLYRFRERGQPAVLIPWDKDRAFGLQDHPIDYHLDAGLLIGRAMGIPALRQIYVETLLQCAALSLEPAPGDPRGWLEREVDRQARQIAPAVAEDPVYPFAIAEFEAFIESMRAFGRVRSANISCQLANAGDSVAVQQRCVVR